MAEGGGDGKAGGGAPPVFISYASQDATVAVALVEALERHGIACWIAPRDVKAGALYADAIVRAISGAKAFVLVLSESAIASSHVSKEIERASSKRRPIIALRIDTAPLTPALEYFLSESQWIEAHAGHIEAAYDKLIAAIREPARAAPELLLAAAPGSSTGAASMAHPKSRRNGILLAVLAVVAVALAVLLAPKFWRAKHVASERPTAADRNVATDKSIAVLPFTDMSEKHDQEYFGDGMAEEIINLLVKIPELKVIGRTSSFQFKEKTDDLRKIGTVLGATYVVEGSVRRSDDHVRVTAQLIDTRDGAHRWSETYDRNANDVLKVQDEIALGVVRALQLEVASPLLTGSKTTSHFPEAYDSYLRGLHATDRYNQAGFEEALADFRHSLELDPTFVPACEALAYSLQKTTAWSFLPPPLGSEQARKAAETALKLDPKSAIAHAVLCAVHTQYDFDWSAAARECRLAERLAPHQPAVLKEASLERMAVGELNEATYAIEAAIAADPLDPNAYDLTTLIYLRAGRVAEAEKAMRRGLAIAPTYAAGHWELGVVLLLEGRAQEALAESQQELSPEANLFGSALAYTALHRRKEADEAIARLESEYPAMCFNIAEAYAYRGQNDRALSWLERALREKDFVLYTVKGDPLLKNLAADPRYKAFLRKMNLPE